MAPESQPGGPGDRFDDAPTQADDDWPVAPQYQVVPEPDLAQQLGEDHGSVTIPSPPRRRGYPAAVIVAAVAALLLLASAAATWLVTRPDAASSSPPPAQSRAGQGATPKNGGGTPGAGTSSSTDTTDPTSETTTTTTTTATNTTTTTNAVPTIAVPDVVGLKASDAARRLRNARLSPRIHLVTSSRANGTVLAQKPAAGADVDVSSSIELRVAKAPAKIAVPSLVGSTAATAKSRLRSLGLHWSLTTQAASRPVGTVLAQSPSPGARVAKGSTVQLTVSSGPAQVSVPDVTGLDEASARAQLTDSGFDVTVVDQPTTDPGQDGMVVDQTPEGGSDAPKGSTVTITVAHLS